MVVFAGICIVFVLLSFEIFMSYEQRCDGMDGWMDGSVVADPLCQFK